MRLIGKAFVPGRRRRQRMVVVVVTLLLLGFVLIATEQLTNVNKAAVAVVVGTAVWVVCICYGTDFVMSQHPRDYMSFLDGAASTPSAAMRFIADNVFIGYLGGAAEIALFLIATMTIVEILQNNGCFDFISQLLRTRSSAKMLWVLSAVTLLISANLDNLTTTVMMLVIMRGVVKPRRQRMLLGSAIVISANCGGAFTVIGDSTGLVLWNASAVTATDFSMSLVLPCLAAWALPVWAIGRSLPHRLDTEWVTMPYRGDDTNLRVWQRLVMLFVGIGGLWFIPTFHNITRLSPFLGALCVVSILWVVNEVFNRRLMRTDMMTSRRVPRALQYGTMQMILYVIGIMLALGLIRETGVTEQLFAFAQNSYGGVWLAGLIAGVVSCFLESFATAMSMITVVDTEVIGLLSNPDYMQNGAYWKVVAYATAVCGNIFCWGSISGLALTRMERVSFAWYVRNVGVKVLAGVVVGFGVLYFAI